MIVAVDPGVNGAAAALSKQGFHDVIDLPTIGEGKRREINATAFCTWLTAYCPDRIVIEGVHSMPGQGVSSTFRFGMAFGALKAVCQMYIGPYRPQLEVVDPTVWHAYFQLRGGDKEASRQMARTLFPNMLYKLERRKDHNRAEALLIAWWAARPPVGRNW